VNNTETQSAGNIRSARLAAKSSTLRLFIHEAAIRKPLITKNRFTAISAMSIDPVNNRTGSAVPAPDSQ